VKRIRISISKNVIARHWAKEISEVKGHPQEEFNKAQRCFACMLNLPLYRAHITPYIETQDNSVENLHLLCQTCHRDSEIMSGDEYWNWLKKRTTLDTIVSMAAFEGKSIKELSKLVSIEHKKWKKDCSTKTRLGIQKIKEQGLAYTNLPPYGKQRSKDGKRFVDNPEEIKLINLVIELRKQLHPFTYIAEYLNQNGYKKRKGTKWNRNTVRWLLSRVRPDLLGRATSLKKDLI